MIYSGKLKRFGVYRNDTAPYKTMEQVKAETGCDIIANGFMYNVSTVKPVFNIKLGGVVLAEDKDKAGKRIPYVGYAWNDGEMPVQTSDMDLKDNFISCVSLVENGIASTFPTYRSICPPTVAPGGGRLSDSMLPATLSCGVTVTRTDPKHRNSSRTSYTPPDVSRRSDWTVADPRNASRRTERSPRRGRSTTSCARGWRGTKRKKRKKRKKRRKR
jgi:hypothetical protein